ncbi:cd7 antigen-like isoform X2 [Antennarius striatus]|uniref:cd7 antigen-like isoform X2 n=1 Tax=Antennarius striatus TaxID=241820 RepID=UPI0035B3278E
MIDITFSPRDHVWSPLAALKMTGIQYLACLWALCITQTGLCHEVQILERHAGQAAVLRCSLERRNPAPLGLYVKRVWRHPSEVLFKYTQNDFTPRNADDKTRITVDGDPSTHSVNVTISQLRPSDTDRYVCDFIVDNPSGEDLHLPGDTEFLLLAGEGSLDVGLVETCAGNSAMLPCLTTNGEGLAVEGMILKRRKDLGLWEVLYHSKHHHNSGAPLSSPSHFPAERVHLSPGLGPTGVTYNLTLQQLQPEDSGLYSCQLLLRGKSDSTHVGRKVFFLSVQEQCGCTRYSTLLYALFAAVAVLLILLVFLLVYQRKTHRSVKPHAQPPIYEEMSGVQTTSRKLVPLHLGEVEASENRNRLVMKSCAGNHYESPRGAVAPQKEYEKFDQLSTLMS